MYKTPRHKQNERLIIQYWADEEKATNDLEGLKRGLYHAFGALFIMCFLILMVKGCSKLAVASDSIDLNTIASIESSDNPSAYNKHSGAVGMYQITPVCLMDYNTVKTVNNKGGAIYLIDDMYDADNAKEVADWYLNTHIPVYLKYYKLEDTIKNRLWAYNAGIGNVIKGRMPLETKQYIAKYERLNSHD